MPRVRMLTSVAGPREHWDEGQEVDMTPEQAKVWADGVRGELVRGPAMETPEKTSTRRGAGYETSEGRANR